MSPTYIWQSFDSACPVLYCYSKLMCLIFYISPHSKYFQPRFAAAAAAAAAAAIDDDDDDDDDDGYVSVIVVC